MKSKLDGHLVAKTSPLGNPNQIYITADFRFTVIAPDLLRVEYDPRSTFTDEATQTVWFRDLGECPYKLGFEEKHITIETEKAKFWINRKKCRPEFVDIGSKRISVNNASNLGGTARTLDGTGGKIKIGKGVVAKDGIAVLEDNSLILGKEGMVKPRHEEKDYYVFATETPARAVELLYSITGRPPMVPRYALGNWWSRYKDYSQQEYLDLMDEFIKRDIPISVATIDMDWHYVDVKKEFGYRPLSLRDFYALNYGWTGYTWNKHLFPDYKEFLKELHKRGLRVTVNLHPANGVRWFEEQYPEMCKAVGINPSTKKSVEFDMTDEAFINAYFSILHKPYERDGVDFWWIDWQQGTKSKIKGYDPLWACNHYHTLDIAKNGTRPLILSRYGGVGSHRYPLGFSGDTKILWSALDFQPYFTSTASNVGYATWSHDLGGHMFGNPHDDELYLRWLQFGVFSPIMRLHSTKNSIGKEPWNHESVYHETVSALKLRHALIPYIYNAYYRNYKYGEPICRPMYWDYPEMKEKYDCPNQYMFGETLLVVPITSKVNPETGKAKIRVRFPAGKWMNVFTFEKFIGDEYELEYGLDEMAVFAKEGAIIPYAETSGNFNGNPDTFRIDVIRGNGDYDLYEDDGISTKYLEGGGAHTLFTLRDHKRTLEFTVNPAVGDVSVLPEKRTYKLRLLGEYVMKYEAFVNGEPIESVTRDGYVTVKGVDPKDELKIIARF